VKNVCKKYLGCFVLILVASLVLAGLGMVFKFVGMSEVLGSGMVFIAVLAFFGRKVYTKYKERVDTKETKNN